MVKGTRLLERNNINISVLRGTKEYLINYFAFYYNNACQIYRDAKYSVSYWPQKPKLKQLRGIKELDKE